VLTVSRVTYTFPRDHVLGFIDEPGRRQFAFVKPSRSRLELVYSSDLKRRSRLNPDGPTVYYINDVPGVQQERIKLGSREVVCRPLLRMQCGILIADGRLVWSVLFDRGDIGEVEQIAGEAAQALKLYRT